MSFDRAKAMRNAERHVAQGKIRAAISEYRNVVSNDPKDISTLNMLGDLHAKNSEKKEAVGCYTLVAEHYSNQGFAQKAIAVYNKISKLQPNSMEVSAKLAELYQIKGSLSEARSHYTTLAEHYQSKGRKIEALAIWKQIALLDPNNTEVYLNVAEAYLQENQIDDAAEAFTEAGLRLARAGSHESAITAFSRALDIKQNDLKALNGLVTSQISSGCAVNAIRTLEEILEKQPYNRDVLYLLIDCHIETENPGEAERAVIKLVEQEPANYPKFLELVQIYLETDDADSAARILAMSSEHLLVGGQADAFSRWVNEILTRKPEHLNALRLLVRYCSWHRDEAAFKESLARLAAAAAKSGSIDDERYALSQLVILVPQDVSYAGRLTEINEKFGFEDNPFTEDILKEQFSENPEPEKPSQRMASSSGEIFSPTNGSDAQHAGLVQGNVSHLYESNGSSADSPLHETLEVKIIDDDALDAFALNEEVYSEDSRASRTLGPSEEIALQKEIESIKFYIDNDYTELAEKSLRELRNKFGTQDEIEELAKQLPGSQKGSSNTEQIIDANGNLEIENSGESKARTLDLTEIRSEFGLEEGETADESDYDTHYQMAVAYQEMGLTEVAIKEFQEAINLVAPNDGTRRFFQCANLLGHCFMENGMAHLALTWFHRALETADLSDEEKQGLWYQLADAYEADGNPESAAEYFEMVYAENVDFRDVSERIKNLPVHH